MTIGLRHAALVALLVWVSSAAHAEPKHVGCVTPTTDPRVTIDDSIDIELRDGMLHSLHWVADRIVRDALTESHSLECDLSIDPGRFSVSRLARGSVAIDRDDRHCRIEVIGTGTHLALVPHCRSRCPAGAHDRALALNTEAGFCRPLGGRTTEKAKP